MIAQQHAEIDWNEILQKAKNRALGSGGAGATAMVIQVCSLMWMRTIMNYQVNNFSISSWLPNELPLVPIWYFNTYCCKNVVQARRYSTVLSRNCTGVTGKSRFALTSQLYLIYY